jgi:hypothetical protein
MEEFELPDDDLYVIEIANKGVSVYDKAAGELWRSYHVVLKFWLNCKKVGELIRNKSRNSFGFNALRQQHEWV